MDTSYGRKSLQRKRPDGILVFFLQNDLERENSPVGDITYRAVGFSGGVGRGEEAKV